MCTCVSVCLCQKEEKAGLKNFCKIETILKCYYLWTTVIKKSSTEFYFYAVFLRFFLKMHI